MSNAIVPPWPSRLRTQAGGWPALSFNDLLATDFGLSGPYIGQVKAVLARLAPDVPAIDLFSDLSAFQPKPAYLLVAYAGILKPGDVLMAVVDPGVGSERLPMMMCAEDRWYVGPDNGILEIIRRRATAVNSTAITWQPPQLSASFHGRDLFAPVAADPANGEEIVGEPVTPMLCGWPDDLPEIVYIDHYGNGMTGLRASSMPDDALVIIDGHRLDRARTFSDRLAGEAFWYENANGLVEIAVNSGSAAERLGLQPGLTLTLQAPG